MADRAEAGPRPAAAPARGREASGAGAAYPGGVSEIPARLTRLRASIDNLDAALVHLLAERFKCTQQVGELKARHGLPPADPQREAQQMSRLRALADESGLDPVFAEKFLAFVIAEVIRNHGIIAGHHALVPTPERPATVPERPATD